MKRIIGLLFLLATLSFATAQIQTPAPSPFCKVTQMVGLTEITLEYSRPGVKGRTIFGDLVPFGQIWRTGANQATKITFGGDVTLAGNEVPAGTYALYTMPGESEWQVMLYKDLALGGNVAKYDEANEFLRFSVEANESSDMIENMTIFIDHIRDNEAILMLVWEKTVISMKIEVNTDETVMAAIEQTMAGPTASDYYRASMYFYNNDKDTEQALAWMEKALEDTERYWMVTRKAQMLHKLGRKNEAMTAAKKGMQMAKDAGNMDYVRMNEQVLEDLK